MSPFHAVELTASRHEIWLANRAVAEAYGLGPDDFAYILSTFSVFTRKRPAFYAYLLERLEEWREEVGAPARGAVALPRCRTASNVRRQRQV